VFYQAHAQAASRNGLEISNGFYTVSVRDPLPGFALPLKSIDEAVWVELSTIFQGVYDRASYDLRIDYGQPPPPPPFSESDQTWIRDTVTR
jgi:hypothetical protein